LITSAYRRLHQGWKRTTLQERPAPPNGSLAEETALEQSAPLNVSKTRPDLVEWSGPCPDTDQTIRCHESHL
jgi:hypothetical protein